MKNISWKDLYIIGQKKDYKKGDVFVLPTDSIYGLHSSAYDQKAIKKIEVLKERELDKSFIILISQISEIEKFHIVLTQNQKRFLQKVWPGPFTIVFKYEGEKFKYLSRGFDSLAFRIPAHKNLLKFIKSFGPVVSTSANKKDQKTVTSKNMDLEKDIKIMWDDEEIKNIDYFLESKNYREGEPSAILKVIR